MDTDSPGTARTGRHDPVLLAVRAASALVAGVATLLATARGPGLGPDSSNYLSAGLDLARNGTLVTFNGTELTMFPPGLPMLVAVGDLIGLAPGTTVRLLNAAAFAAIVLLGSALLARHVRSRRLVCCATALIALSPALLGVYEMALTDGLFATVVVLFVLLVEQVLRSARPWPWVVAAAATVGAAFLLRYAGIALVPLGAGVIFLGRWRRSARGAVAAATCFGVLAMVVPALVMARNHRINGTFMGGRAPSPDGLLTTVARFVATLGRWLAPDPMPRAVQGLVGAALVLALAVGACWALWDPRRRRVLCGPGVMSLLPLAAVTAGYAAYLVAAQLVTAFDPIGTRLMSPMLVPGLVLLAVAVDRAWPLVPSARRGAARVVLTVVAAALLLGHAATSADQVRRSGADGVGYASVEWTSSESVAVAAALPDEVVLYSNAPGGLWAATERTPLLRSPARQARRSDLEVPMSQEFLDDVACSDVRLLWIDDIPGDFLYEPDELRAYVEVTVEQELGDGVLFRLGPLDDTDSPDSRC